MEKEYWRKEEFCKEFDMPEDTFWKLCRDGALPAVKIGRRWYVSREGLRKMFSGADHA